MIFLNRNQAGNLLAAKLKESELGGDNLLVLAIPRGGVVVGQALAEALNSPADIILVKKIGAPNNPELAIGAIGAFGEPTIDEELAKKTGADDNYIKNQISKIKIEIQEREKIFRSDKPPLDLKSKIVILTDDGVATGSTVVAAINILRQQNPKKIIVAVPVIAKDALAKIESVADEVVYLEAPEMFFAVGQFYKDFSQITDEEVLKLLQ
jgi:predicted phosphoribosyltransferase